MQITLPDWPRAAKYVLPQARFREQAADFQVTELLGFNLTGDGEHLFVLVEKEGVNTAEVSNVLARATGCHPRDVGCAGMKDRVSIARQWFSLKVPGSLEADSLIDGKVRILEQHRNSRKLRTGSHQGNRFVIRLRRVTGEYPGLEARLEQIAHIGVPNYFGPQRFGKAGGNLAKAVLMFDGTGGKVPRFQRGIYLSAARAYLFNQVLARRVSDGTWDLGLSGDVMLLAGTSSFFKTVENDPDLPARLDAGDIHPTGPLWGKGPLPASGTVLELENSIVGQFAAYAQGLERAGLKQERRALRVIPEGLSMKSAGEGELVIEFTLPKGAFATSVIRELVTAAGL